MHMYAYICIYIYMHILYTYIIYNYIAMKIKDSQFFFFYGDYFMGFNDDFMGIWMHYFAKCGGST